MSIAVSSILSHINRIQPFQAKQSVKKPISKKMYGTEFMMAKPKASNNTVRGSADNSQQKIPRTAWMVLAILGFTQIITMYGETMLLPAIPDIIEDFNISYNTSSWILSAYFIAGAVAAPISGKLSDIYGRKKMVLIIMTIYIFGIGIGGLSPNITFLVITRAIQGIGISVFPIAFSIIKHQFPNDKLAIAIGVFSSMSAAGSVVGLVLGADTVENFGWRSTFLSIIPITVALWFVINRFICESARMSEDDDSNAKKEIIIDNADNRLKRANGNNSSHTRSIDIKGTIFLAATITLFLMVLSYSWADNLTSAPEIIGLLSAGSISLVMFVLIERRSKSPLVNLQLLTNKIILSANIILIITFLTMFAVFQTIPILVRSPQPLGFGGEATTIASIQLPFMIVFLLFAPSSGIIISKLGNVKPTILGSIITAIGFFSLLLFHSTAFLVSMNLAIIAAGLSLTRVGGLNIVLESTPRQFSGISLGMTALFKMIGSSIGPAVAGILMQTNQTVVNGITGSFPSSESYNLIFLTIALTSLVPLLLAPFLRKKLMPPHPALAEKETKC
jgi:MFS family permease